MNLVFNFDRTEIAARAERHLSVGGRGQYSGGTTVKTLIRRFAEDQSGATAIEYGLIATLIAVAIIAGASALGVKLNSVFQGLKDTLDDPSA